MRDRRYGLVLGSSSGRQRGEQELQHDTWWRGVLGSPWRYMYRDESTVWAGSGMHMRRTVFVACFLFVSAAVVGCEETNTRTEERSGGNTCSLLETCATGNQVNCSATGDGHSCSDTPAGLSCAVDNGGRLMCGDGPAISCTNPDGCDCSDDC